MFENPANCAGTETDEWFTEDGVGKTYNNVDTLKRICGACEAKQECLQYALEWNVLGFWAGTSEFQRRRLRKELNIIPKSIISDNWEWKRKYA
jgi:WhiB family redox-sensing transcriptional regulator